MNLAIIGASAGVGFEALQQALKSGHHVRSLSRTGINIQDHQHLTDIEGSATSIEDLIKVLDGTDGALITIGSKKKKNITLFSEMANAFIKAAGDIHYTKPILIVSGFGVGDSYNYSSFFIKTVINLFLKDQYKDKDMMEKLFVKSNLNWEIIQPGILSNGKLSGKYSISTNLSEKMKVGKIPRSDLANFMLKEVMEKTYIHKKVVITN
jgi:putative NADH-flavin reductase